MTNSRLSYRSSTGIIWQRPKSWRSETPMAPSPRNFWGLWSRWLRPCWSASISSRLSMPHPQVGRPSRSLIPNQRSHPRRSLARIPLWRHSPDYFWMSRQGIIHTRATSPPRTPSHMPRTLRPVPPRPPSRAPCPARPQGAGPLRPVNPRPLRGSSMSVVLTPLMGSPLARDPPGPPPPPPPPSFLCAGCPNPSGDRLAFW